MTNGSELCIIGHEKSETNIKLLAEAKKKFSSVFFVPISGIYVGLTDKFSINYRTTDIFKFKAIMPRVPPSFCSYAYQLLSMFPEDTFMPIRPISFLLSSERFFLLTVLRKRGIDTINLRLTRSSEAAARIIGQNSFPLIIRSPEKKTGVVVKNQIEAKSVIDALIAIKQPILIEDMVENMISVYVAEPEVLAAVKKKTKEKDVIFAPGQLKNHKITIEEQHIALETARAIEAKIARIDISIDKKPRVVNVNLNPNLIEPIGATKVDLPKLIVGSVYESYEEYKEKPLLMRFFEDAKSVVKDVLKTKHLI